MPKKKEQTAEKVLKLAKDIIVAKSDSFRDKLIKAVSQDTKNLVLDFSKVVTIDSIGLGIIINAYNTLKKGGSTLTLINVSDELYSFFTVLRLDQAFEIRSRQ